MNGAVLRVVWYRFRATLVRRRGAYLSVILLVGVLGGVAMAAVAGARRTESSYPAFLRSTNNSDLFGGTAVINPDLGSVNGYNPDLIRAIAHAPHVKRVRSYSGINLVPIGPDGGPIRASLASPGNGSGSVDGLYFDQDRATVVQGRLPNPDNPDEFAEDAPDVRYLGLHVGQVVPMGVYTNEQTQSPDFGTAKIQPYRRFNAKLVGIVVLNTSLVQDDSDAAVTLTAGLYTPARTRPLLGCCVNYSETGIQVDAKRNVAAVEAEIQQLLPKGVPPFREVSTVIAKAQRAVKPYGIALAGFGAVAALASLLIAAQLIGRQLRLGGDDLAVLRALGAGPWVTGGDGLIGMLGSVVVGSAVAVAVAIALSPLFPLGPVARFEPGSRVSADWTVLGLGLVALIVSLGVITAALAVASAPHRTALRPGRVGRGSSVARAGATAGLPAPAVTGLRFALEPGAGGDPIPVRSAILGATLAMVVVAAALTFGASLHALVSHPALYGWNWDYALAAGSGSGDIPAPHIAQLLDADHDVTEWSGASFSTLTIDGQAVPVLAERPGDRVRPPVLSGHGLDGSTQVVLGASTLVELHKHVGDVVEVSNGVSPVERLRIVGTTALPALSPLEMGTGAIVSPDRLTAAQRNTFNDPIPGPNAIFVRVRRGARPAVVRKALERIAEGLSNSANFGVAVVKVQRPAEIVNYRSVGSTPALLAAGLAAGAASALGLTLLASVRRRRRDLALLKTLGFTRRQVAAAIAWQASVATGIGIAVGAPAGILLGRVLWDTFAREIHALPRPSVPAVAVMIVGLAGLLLTNVIAAVPGRIAAGTPTAHFLRSE